VCLLGGFLGGQSEAPRRLTNLVYRLVCGVLQPLLDLTHLIPYLTSRFPDLTGRPFGHLPDLLGRTSSHFSHLAGGFASNLADLVGRSSSNLPDLPGHFPDLLGRSPGYLPDLTGCSFGHFSDLLGYITQGVPQAAQALFVLLTFCHPFSFPDPR
jgi:hypothetical protein